MVIKFISSYSEDKQIPFHLWVQLNICYLNQQIEFKIHKIVQPHRCGDTGLVDHSFES